MLLDKQARTVAFERANIVRSVEYMRNMAEDSLLHDRMTEIYEATAVVNESVEEAEDMEIMEAFTAEGDEGREEEISKILEATSDMSFDTMIGVEDNYVDYNLMEEGVNVDAVLIRNKLRKVCLKALISSKKALKKGDKQEALKKIAEAKKALVEAEKEFKRLEFTGGILETVVGVVLKSTNDFLVDLAGSIATFGFGTKFIEIGILVQTIVDTGNQVLKDIKKGKLEIGTFNTNKNKTISMFESSKKALDKLEKGIKETVVKESVRNRDFVQNVMDLPDYLDTF